MIMCSMACSEGLSLFRWISTQIFQWIFTYGFWCAIFCPDWLPQMAGRRAAAEVRAQRCTCWTAVFRTKILPLCGFDSSRILCFKGMRSHRQTPKEIRPEGLQFVSC